MGETSPLRQIRGLMDEDALPKAFELFQRRMDLNVTGKWHNWKWSTINIAIKDFINDAMFQPSFEFFLTRILTLPLPVIGYRCLAQRSLFGAGSIRQRIPNTLTLFYIAGLNIYLLHIIAAT